jgi:hypothetical protein
MPAWSVSGRRPRSPVQTVMACCLRLQEGKRWRFRCHTGHAYSLVSLLAAVDEGIDGALWIAIRALDEGGRILTHPVEHHGVAEGDGQQMTQGAEAAFRDADTLRTVADRRGRRGDVEG